MSDDTVYRQAVIEVLNKLDVSDGVGISSVACNLQKEAIRSIEILPSVQQKPLKYTGESICDYCRTTNCKGCMYEPMTTEEGK